MRRHNIDERGVTAVEYALLIAVVAVALVFAVPAIGSNLSNVLGNKVNPALAGGTPTATPTGSTCSTDTGPLLWMEIRWSDGWWEWHSYNADGYDKLRAGLEAQGDVQFNQVGVTTPNNENPQYSYLSSCAYDAEPTPEVTCADGSFNMNLVNYYYQVDAWTHWNSDTSNLDEWKHFTFSDGGIWVFYPASGLSSSSTAPDLSDFYSSAGGWVGVVDDDGVAGGSNYMTVGTDGSGESYQLTSTVNYTMLNLSQAFHFYSAPGGDAWAAQCSPYMPG